MLVQQNPLYIYIYIKGVVFALKHLVQFASTLH